ncbi:hypothetical protein AVEN_192109-1 [Araneus ventricosus]|uniref:Uncharacterized protein n=1 Tax=Araneus ventricosus TaxID=182803 RepID=A0A4Y2B7D0_ARAVE|nr:hypothetical protein AVEN_192109-1 [Araneus ventricosus]
MLWESIWGNRLQNEMSSQIVTRIPGIHGRSKARRLDLHIKAGRHCEKPIRVGTEGFKATIHLKYSHAISPKPAFFSTHFYRKIQARHSLVFRRTITLNEGGGAIFFLSLQLLVNRSSIFPSQQILIYATLEARLQSTQGIALFSSLFQGASDFSFRFQSRRNSNHGKPFGSFP